MKKSGPKTPQKKRLSFRKSPKKSRSSEKRKKQEEKKRLSMEREYVKILNKVIKSVKEMKHYLEKNEELKPRWLEYLTTI